MEDIKLIKETNDFYDIHYKNGYYKLHKLYNYESNLKRFGFLYKIDDDIEEFYVPSFINYRGIIYIIGCSSQIELPDKLKTFTTSEYNSHCKTINGVLYKKIYLRRFDLAIIPPGISTHMINLSSNYACLYKLSNSHIIRFKNKIFLRVNNKWKILD